MKSVHIFGATGSIGQSAADVIAAHPEKFSVHTVTAGSNAQKLAETAIRLNAKTAVIAQSDAYNDLKAALSGSGISCAAGVNALADASLEPVDLSIMAIVGIAGLRPLWSAMEHSRSVAIANKEPLVAAGALVMARAAQFGTRILPLDSEHNAIFQCLEPHNKNAISRIILTASGGPFRTWSIEDMAGATLEQALKHPNWTMGDKITIDSATMMNKALELIEARFLFDMPSDKIEVLIHPQSVMHGMVEYEDGSFLCQMGASDMRTPIAHALGWPERISTPGKKLDLLGLKNLSFDQPDFTRFPALSLAYTALEKGAGACIAMNAANEVMVQEFLSKRCGFLDIVQKTSTLTMEADYPNPRSLDDVEAIDQEVRDRLKCAIVSSEIPKVSQRP